MMKRYQLREKILWFALISRVFVLIAQFILNLLCPDHDAGVFISPKDQFEIQERSIWDTLIHLFLGGLTRWDAQYFLHIAKYGYTYENTLAFFPLFPWTIRCLTKIFLVLLLPLGFSVQEDSVLLLTATLLNLVCFVGSACTLYDLSYKVLGDPVTAYKASVLFCINPASIFFTAAYTESMFTYLTFRSMLAYAEGTSWQWLSVSLSAIVRSNGLTNIGFLVYGWLQKTVDFIQASELTFLITSSRPISYQRRIQFVLFFGYHLVIRFMKIIGILILTSSPFLLIQVYNYLIFCVEEMPNFPKQVLDYGFDNGFLLPGSRDLLWCRYSIPMAYSHVQSRYLYEHKSELYTLGLKQAFIKSRYSMKMFVFVVHGLFLTIFCLLFVHIQVSTRLLCSASPLVYWYCAYIMSYQPEKLHKNMYTICEYPDNLISKWRVFFMTQEKYTTNDKLVLIYFIGYLLIGCFMYSNFLPWT
ncbi:GPI mannosyltransferase 2 isoform X3 [Cephus cinctus]|uniref:GPI mannosyltransferase 2 n=1 Tax=Cephus cinctus TaxID=211228 RepID=A0AAJ7RI11_CEPCN|nr:GPI mannosyltransferase 2 isoform X3 [Cephus cinctus]